ncbi:sulfotransferase domain-containing protein [Limibaculum sp. M0105]|uniref:Sulfotransferase domain-containing protein n=1 Tax=Thermohalobaculum xanthum TaxID=2753746 RepID=A0A8J7M970_9RHOB|nr:sulfotransferase domain-containing protein [Thermohalobaculum xanthum]MBK0400540.1 sulfotransferase domain-containing protein [Thermohalobaculum xanthum]
MQTAQRIIWLASYPKSGNTWTRSFLANYFAPKGGELDINSLRQFTTGDVRQDFFDRAAGRPFHASDFDEWLLVRPKALRLIALSKPHHHFVKTHSRIERIGHIDLIPPEVTAAAIYIIRNPFDVAQSYARHLATDLDEAIDRMLDRRAMNFGPTMICEVLGSWETHVQSWVNAVGLPLHVMRYEDMAGDPERAFRGLLSFLRAPVNDGQLRRAIRGSSFDQLRKQEEKAGFVERPPGMERFFSKGKAGSWRDDLAPSHVARLREAFLPTIVKWYPELVEETASFAAGK